MAELAPTSEDRRRRVGFRANEPLTHRGIATCGGKRKG
jgi:hypothetical protein